MTHRRLNNLFIAIISALICAFLISLMGCGTPTCQRQYTGGVRTLDTVFVVDKHSADYGLGFINRCGHAWFLQTGIKINVIETIQIAEWKAFNHDTAIDELKEIVNQRLALEEYDIVIGLGSSVEGAMTTCLTMFVPIPTWAGVIDELERRYIRLKMTDCWIMQHELAHAFVFSHVHSDEGLLGPMGVSFFPGMSINSVCLTKTDWDEVMRNKYRNFNVPIGLD